MKIGDLDPRDDDRLCTHVSDKSLAVGGGVLEAISSKIYLSDFKIGMTSIKSVNLKVNGQIYELDIGKKPGQIDPSDTLVHTLRETLGLTGTKSSCGQGACGVCTVIMDSKAVLPAKF